MRLLYMMPNFYRPSEPWTHRMLEGVKDRTALVVAGKCGGQTELLGVPLMEAYALPKGTSALHRFPALWPLLFRHARISREVRRRGVTHALCHYGTFAQLYDGLWRRLGLKAFVHFHGMDATWDLRRSEPPHRPVHPRDYAPRVLRMAESAILIANSHHTAGQLARIGVPPERVRVKRLGVSVPPEARRHEDRRPARVVAVGRLVDVKAPQKTVEAFGRAVALGLDAELDLVGEGPMRAACEAARAALPEPRRARLHGALPFQEVEALLARADVFTQHNVVGPVTGQMEAFGVTVIEAMARGLPVVVAASGGVTETVPGPSVGALFEPGDVQAQAQGLLRFGLDPSLRQRAGEAGRAHVLANFTHEIERARLLEILEEEGPATVL
jgi:glycosyltransferase involved in cell wall biosynthesis